MLLIVNVGYCRLSMAAQVQSCLTQTRTDSFAVEWPYSVLAHISKITYLQISQLCQLLEPCKGLIRGSLPQASFKESLKESLKQSVAMHRYMYIYACLQQRTSS